jgi:peptide/nickel transport system substrate-binding protein
MVLAPVIMIVVIIVVGAGGYAALNAVSGSGSTTVTSCAPADSPQCKAATGANNVNTFVPYSPAFGSSVLVVSQGQTLPVTVSVPGSTASSFQVNWGDGITSTQGSGTLTHMYAGLGTYIVSAEAEVGGVWHTGTNYLYPVNVGPSLQTQSSGEFPTIAATLTNGSTAASQFGWLKGSGTISVSASYSAPPANPAFVPQTASITSTGGTKGTSTGTAAGASASYTFSTAGVYEINFTGPILNTGSNAIVFQNYTWTVFVSPASLNAGCGQCRTSSSGSVSSPHAGSITDYEVVPAGGTSVDPAIDYETVGAEMIYNVYQTLITYNGSSTSTFIPQLATCVPGSAQCTAQYGENLTFWNNTIGGTEWWTFVVDKNARFYDPVNKVSWPVYPTDVEYSVARTLSFADLPGIESTAGWILAQALLPAGNPAWDVSPLTGVGIHQPFNNTPSNIFASMLVNDSAYCPAAAMTSENGCITFAAIGPGAQNGYTAPRSWSNFLQFIADPLGGGVEPSGWYNGQGLGAAIPGWPATTSPLGHSDGPTFLPGDATSSTASSYLSAIAAISPTAWDSMQEQMLVAYPSVNTETRYYAIGSGPYYLVSFNPSVGYSLEANPAYVQPSGCAGLTWCEPAAHNYAANVTVYWESTDTLGIQQYISGHTDFATILTPDTPTLLSLVQQGKIGAFTAPTLNLFFFNYALTFDVVAAQSLDPFTLNVPGTFFASDSVRNFLNLAYPYTTIENTINTVDGIVFGYNYGGAIPNGMGNYFPENISWPDTDPVTSTTQVGSAGWWWAQMNTAGSPYYDAYVATNCKAASPCEFPIIGELGDPALDSAIQLWIHEIESISGGALQPNTFDLSFGELYVTSVSSTPGDIPLPIYTLGWAPDYPDPTDYLPTLWTNGSYGLPDAAYYTFSQAAYNNPDCGHLDNLPYWANMPQVPADCQGVAFMTLDYWSGIASSLPAGPNRVLIYNMIEHIGAALSLTQYTFQQAGVGTYAPWVNPATIDINPMWAGDALFYFFQGNGVQYKGST